MELDRQHLGVEAGAAAGVAGDPDVGQEVHLDPLLPVALAGLAPAAGHVEAEPARRVAADLGLGQLGEQLADQVEHAGVGGRVRVGRRSQGRLIDVDDLVDLVQALDLLVGPGGEPGAVQRLGGGLPEDVLDQRALARAADARHDGDDPSGMRTSRFLRLFCRAPRITIAGTPAAALAGLRLVGTGIASLPAQVLARSATSPRP